MSSMMLFIRKQLYYATACVVKYVGLVWMFSLLYSCSPPGKLKDPSKLNVVKFRTIGKVPVIVADLNGKSAIFIIDTGASVSVINESEVKHFNFKIRRSGSSELASTQVLGFGGRSSLNAVYDCSIKIGNRSINTLYKSRDMSDLADIVCRGEVIPFAGILGADVLYRYRMNIDFGKSQITCQ